MAENRFYWWAKLVAERHPSYVIESNNMVEILVRF